MIFSCVIPALNDEDPKLKDLIQSIKEQDFPQDQIEILVIKEGDSEQAKAIGIRRSKGEICAMFCSDNKLVEKDLFKKVYQELKDKRVSAVYPYKYAYTHKDNILNRYFSLLGGNDPICWFLGKNDRKPYVEALERTSDYQPSYGCNGFFYRASDIKNTDLDHYYPMDNAMEVPGFINSIYSRGVWHRTSDNLFTFLKKRYRYAKTLYSDRSDRRWKMLDTKEDYQKLGLYIISTLTVIPCLMVSIKGYSEIKDKAFFLHWPVCFGFLLTYGVLTLRTFFARLLSRRWDVLNPFQPA